MAPRLRLPFSIPYLRVFYSTTYTSLFILELGLLGITPTALIYSAISERALQYIVIIGGVYVLVALLVLFIYSSRLYTNRTVLAALGKSYIPVEDGEVSKAVRKLIKSQLDRSAAVALECRPRNLAEAGPIIVEDSDRSMQHDGEEKARIGRLAKIDPSIPPWGLVKHPGWSSPNPNETTLTPHVFFMQIISELPNLLEARVVSLGGPPRSSDRRAVIESEYPGSQKPPLLGIREYLDYLDSEGAVMIPEAASDFIDRFENARFSGRPFSEHDFVGLTAAFADLLSNMQEGENPHEFSPSSNSRPIENGVLPTIEDGASMASRSTRNMSFDSSVSSSTTINETTDSEYRAPYRRPTTPALVMQNRSGSVVGRTMSTSNHSSLASSRQVSTTNLESATSVVQQAQAERRRRLGR
ncbi:hypothetical protein BDZ85DRAFT_264771 [Elsinoe ampelina]|uniref:Defect at low temperature protein 1 n=1 Tax=Elsinoe ampelina TaxID=302913 RepID=A0A6A6G8F4_9PEZI|nr:hypothetical protein BDZ85DRAFT_264771 [Elsinoe ampelina]